MIVFISELSALLRTCQSQNSLLVVFINVLNFGSGAVSTVCADPPDCTVTSQRHLKKFNSWEHPFSSYLGIGQGLGRFLGFWAVLMQAAFSFFGSEVPGIVRFAHSFNLDR